jgi:hypothetical protein
MPCSDPSAAKLADVTVNVPFNVLQPRPFPETSRPGPAPLNGYRVALAYVEPAARMSPCAGTNSALHQSPPEPLMPKPAKVRPPPIDRAAFASVYDQVAPCPIQSPASLVIVTLVVPPYANPWSATSNALPALSVRCKLARLVPAVCGTKRTQT